MQSLATTSTVVMQMDLLAGIDDNTIQERFVRFHKQYPKVYDLFESFALQLIKKGHKKLGARMIIERIRWEFATSSVDDDGFKINNYYIAHYARLFIQRHPVYAEYIETRKIRTV